MAIVSAAVPANAFWQRTGTARWPTGVGPPRSSIICRKVPASQSFRASSAASIRQYVEHYHAERPDQGLGIDNALLVPRSPPDDRVPLQTEIACHERLGGLLKHYRRAA